MALKCIIYCAYKELHSSAYEQRGVVLRVLLHSEGALRVVEVHMAIYRHHRPAAALPTSPFKRRRLKEGFYQTSEQWEDPIQRLTCSTCTVLSSTSFL